MVDGARERLGPITILVNNAAIRPEAAFQELSLAEWHEVLGIVLDGAFLCCQAVLPHMLEAGWGRIVSLGGLTGHTGATNRAHVVTSKAGLIGFTKALALEVAKKNVTVNTISPGYIGTKMVTAIPKEVLDSKILPHIPVGRLGKPEEVAGLIIYLASEEAAFVTGANIAINGGQHRL